MYTKSQLKSGFISLSRWVWGLSCQTKNHYRLLSLCLATAFLGISCYLNMMMWSYFYQTFNGDSLGNMIQFSKLMLVHLGLYTLGEMWIKNQFAMLSSNLQHAYAMAVYRVISSKNIMRVAGVKSFAQKMVHDLENLTREYLSMMHALIFGFAVVTGNIVFLLKQRLYTFLAGSLAVHGVVLWISRTISFGLNKQSKSLEKSIKERNTAVDTLRNEVTNYSVNAETMSVLDGPRAWHIARIYAVAAKRFVAGSIRISWYFLANTVSKLYNRLQHPLLFLLILITKRPTFPLARNPIAGSNIMHIALLQQSIQAMIQMRIHLGYFIEKADSVATIETSQKSMIDVSKKLGVNLGDVKQEALTKPVSTEALCLRHFAITGLMVGLLPWACRFLSWVYPTAVWMVPTFRMDYVAYGSGTLGLLSAAGLVYRHGLKSAIVPGFSASIWGVAGLATLAISFMVQGVAPWLLAGTAPGALQALLSIVPNLNKCFMLMNIVLIYYFRPRQIPSNQEVVSDKIPGTKKATSLMQKKPSSNEMWVDNPSLYEGDKEIWKLSGRVDCTPRKGEHTFLLAGKNGTGKSATIGFLKHRLCQQQCPDLGELIGRTGHVNTYKGDYKLPSEDILTMIIPQNFNWSLIDLSTFDCKMTNGTIVDFKGNDLAKMLAYFLVSSPVPQEHPILQDLLRAESKILAKVNEFSACLSLEVQEAIGQNKVLLGGSGGQQSQVLLAVLAGISAVPSVTQKHCFILLDEPSKGLDSEVQTGIFKKFINMFKGDDRLSLTAVMHENNKEIIEMFDVIHYISGKEENGRTTSKVKRIDKQSLSENFKEKTVTLLTANDLSVEPEQARARHR